MAKLSDAAAEAAETQTWLEFAVQYDYLDSAAARELYQTSNQLLGQPVRMLTHPNQWTLLKQP